MRSLRDDPAALAAVYTTGGIALVMGSVVVAPIVATAYGAHKLHSWLTTPQPVPTDVLYEEAVRLARDADLPSREVFSQNVCDGLPAEGVEEQGYPALPLFIALLDVANALYAEEGLTAITTPPHRADDIEQGRYRDMLLRQFRKLADPTVPERLRHALVRMIADFSSHLSPIARATAEQLEDRETATLPLIDTLRNPGAAVEALCLPFYAQGVLELDLFRRLRDQLDANLHEASDTIRNRGSVTMPTNFKGEPRALVHAYLKNTPLEALFHVPIPFAIPEETRFEHHWIVAGTGHGKTQTLQHLIAGDLDLVAQGAASVVVIDSQGDMIRKLSRLKFFAEHPDKLCLIDPTDIEYPVALNLFDMGTARMRTYGTLEREKLQNAAIEVYEYILAALLGAEMTAKQSTLFRYVLRAMLNIEGATIHTFRELMEGSDKYRDAIERLPFTARTFMETEFNSREHEQTKRQVVRRLWGILENQSFERMFSHPKNKLDMFAEMNAGKVILINTAKDLLKQEGSDIFGRFFIALISQAAQERSAVPSARLPCFVYIDECADYLDQNVGVILAQARKFNVGMILAHQYIGQLPPRLQEGFDANTSIKFVGGVSSADARAFARMLRCEPSFIEEQPKGHFAAFVRNLTDRAVSIRVPFGRLEAMPKMSSDEWERVRASVRERYAARPDQPPPAATSRDTPRPADTGDDWRS